MALYTDADIAKLDSSQPTSFTDADIAKIDSKAKSKYTDEDIAKLDSESAVPPLYRDTSAPEGPKRGIVEDIAKSVGSGFIKGGQLALHLEQNTANLIGKGLEMLSGKPVEVAQWYGDLANKMEETRSSFYGDSKSVLGKSVEALATLPAVIGLVGAGGETGVITKGTEAVGGLTAPALAAIATKYPSLAPALAPVIGAIGKGALSNASAGFGALGALEAAPQGGLEMVKQGVIGVAQGAIIGKAAKLPLIPGTLIAGGAMAAPTLPAAMEGEATPQDVASQFVMGAGFNVLSQHDLRTLHQRAYADLKNIPKESREFVQRAVDLHYASEQLKAVTAEIKTTEAERKVDLTRHQQNTIMEQERIKTEKTAAEERFGTAESKVETIRKRKVQEEKNRIAEDINKFEKVVDKIEKDMDANSAEVVDQVKSGHVKTMNEQLEKSYDNGINTIGTIIEKTKPFTIIEEKAFLEKCKVDAERVFVDPNDPIMKKIDARLRQIGSGGIGSEGDRPRFMMGDKMTYNEAVNKLGKEAAATFFPDIASKIKTSDNVPFGELKARIGILKSGPDSLVGEILNNNFKHWVEVKLEGTGLEGSFTTLQNNYSSVRKTLDHIENMVKGGETEIGGMQKFFKDATKIDSNIANKRLLAFIERGAGGKGMVSGVGDLTSTIKDMNIRLSQAQVEMQRLKDPGYRETQAGQKYVDGIAKLAEKGELHLKRLAQEQTKLLSESKMRIAQIEAEYQVKLTDPKIDQIKFKKLTQQKHSMVAAVSAVLYGMIPFNAKLFRLLRAGVMGSRTYI